MNLSAIGHWSFIIGIILAVLAGLVTIPSSLLILFVLGLIVGLLNISEKESSSFLIAVIALVVIGVAGLQFGGLTVIAGSMLENFLSFVSAAGLIVALKEVISAATPS
jgi:hypothetical protein